MSMNKYSTCLDLMNDGFNQYSECWIYCAIDRINSSPHGLMTEQISSWIITIDQVKKDLYSYVIACQVAGLWYQVLALVHKVQIIKSVN